MKCIGLECKYCFEDDFKHSVIGCRSQRRKFYRENYRDHECTIQKEIETKIEELNEDILYAKWLESKNE